jgi:protein-S-isoprenylcysteine O-methyltransferase Ste14
MATPTKIIAVYFSCQALLVAAWWILLGCYPPAVRWFLPQGFPSEALTAFWLADFVLLIVGSLLAAFGIVKERAWAMTAVWVVAAVSWYPTLYCLMISWTTDSAWIATALMACMATISLAMAHVYANLNRTREVIRAVRMSRRHAILWTFAQVVVFWGLFLWIVPRGIVEFTTGMGGTPFHDGGPSLAAMILFSVASGLGLWSAWCIAIQGGGTPLPTATAPELVVVGPYRFIRNPMAVAGIAQGVAVGWYLGSAIVIVYAICGAFVWQYVAQPVEERDLIKRFGEPYFMYRHQVPLWIPAFRSGRCVGCCRVSTSVSRFLPVDAKIKAAKFRC